MKDLIVAVCSCPAGVAHTYMAADKFSDVASSMGYDVKVETQGMAGIEDRLTDDDLKKAKWIVLANEVKLRDSERFDNYSEKVIQAKLGDLLHEPRLFIQNHLK